MRYNGYPAAEINGAPAPGLQFRPGRGRDDKLVTEQSAHGMGFEWTELTYQRILAGNTAVYVFPLCVLLVFLVLAAQYESLSLAAGHHSDRAHVLCSSPSSGCGSQWDNNIFTQIGFIVLVGLACKNAILIVEFAEAANQDEGMSPCDAAMEACRLRLRPILMTSVAFIGRRSPGLSTGPAPKCASHGRGRVRRHDRCHFFRPLSDPGLLRSDSAARRGPRTYKITSVPKTRTRCSGGGLSHAPL